MYKYISNGWFSTIYILIIDGTVFPQPTRLSDMTSIFTECKMLLDWMSTTILGEMHIIHSNISFQSSKSYFSTVKLLMLLNVQWLTTFWGKDWEQITDNETNSRHLTNKLCYKSVLTTTSWQYESQHNHTFLNKMKSASSYWGFPSIIFCREQKTRSTYNKSRSTLINVENKAMQSLRVIW